MVHADHTMIALHKGHPGIPAHTAGRTHTGRPATVAGKGQRTVHAPVTILQVQVDKTFRKAVGPDADIQGCAKGAEVTGIKRDIAARIFRAIQDLDKRFRIFFSVAFVNTGDNRQAVPLFWIDAFVVPPFKKGAALFFTVVAFWL